MLWTGRISSDEWKINICLCHVGKFNLCLFSSFKKSLSCHFVSAEVNSVIFFELGNHPIHNFFIKVVAAKVSIAVGCLYLESAFTEFKNRYIKRAAAEVKNQNSFILILIETICESCGSRFIDNSQDLKTCDLTCVLGSLTLRVAEVCRNSDNSLTDSFTQISLRISLEFLQNHCGNFRWSVRFVINSNFVTGFTHMAFD